MTALLVALFIGDHPALFRFEQHRMTLDEVYTDRAALETRPGTELGGSVKRIEIKKVDQVRGTTTGRPLPAWLIAVGGAGRCCSRLPSPPLRARPTRQRNRPRSACGIRSRCRTGRRPTEVDDEPTPSASPFADRSTDELFDPASLHTFEFTVAERDLQFLDSDPTAEEYVPATMTFEGETTRSASATRDRSARSWDASMAPTCSTRVAPRAASCR